MSAAGDRTVRRSIIDRLIDLQPGIGDPPGSWTQSVEELERSVLRDLEWLLNTRRIAEPAPDRFPEVQHSVYHFGLPDISSRSADSPDTLQGLAREMEECIRVFEPRLTSVRVAVRRPKEKGSRLAHFSIEALLRMDPNPERVIFDTVLDTPTGKFHLESGPDA
jgi:type VI secretion system protein ImpF